MEDRPPLARLLQPLAISVLLGALLLRWWIPGGTAGTGMNALIHSLLLLGAAFWMLGNALHPAWTLRMAGPAIPFFLLAVLGFFSLLWASYKLPTLTSAFAYLSLGALLVALLNLFAPRRRLLLTLLFAFTFTVAVYAVLQRYVLLPEAREAAVGDPRFQGPEAAARLKGNEVWGTFLYPNSLAGFLALVLPIALGNLLDDRRLRLPQAILLGAAGFALYLTGSLGGWVAAGFGILVLGVLFLTRRAPRMRRAGWIAGGAVALLLLGLVAAGPLSPARIGHESMRIRDSYWSAALRMAKDRPILGVGLDNYQEYYPAYKGDVQQEVRKAHNDYLQILAELGAIGAILFLAFFLWTARHAVGPPRSEAVPLKSGGRERLWIGGIGVTSLLLAWLFTGAFGPRDVVLLGLAWIAAVAVLHPAERAASLEKLEGTRLGTVAGFLALSLHMAVDYDFYDFGVAAALIVGVALLLILHGRLGAYRLGRTPAVVLSSLVLVPLLPLLLLAVPRLLEADHLRKAAENKSGSALKLEAEARDLRGRAERVLAEGGQAKRERAGRLLGRADDLDLRAADLFTQARKELEKGQDLIRIDAGFYLDHAELSLFLWERHRRKTDYRDEEILRLTVFEETVLGAIEKALAVRPRSVGAESMAAQCHRRFASFYEAAAARRAERRGLFRALARHHRLRAVEGFQRALRLYPTLAPAHYATARAMDEEPSTGDPLPHYREALRLSALAAKENLSRLQLSPLQKSRALFRLGRDEDANALLGPWIRSQFREANLQALLGPGDRLREILGEDYDVFMKPRVDAVLERMLKEPR